MSKLSIKEEVGIITAHSNICKCGRQITREADQANGICRLCNPFSVNESIKEVWNREFGFGEAYKEDIALNPNPLERTKFRY